MCDCVINVFEEMALTDLYLQEDDPLKGLPIQPVADDGECGSLDDERLSHSFHMIPRDQCGGVMDEFVTHLGAHEESEAPLKQRVDALQRENESLKRRIDMLEQENQSLMRDQVWLGSKPLHRRPC